MMPRATPQSRNRERIRNNSSSTMVDLVELLSSWDKYRISAKASSNDFLTSMYVTG